jgi:hypothetical protein
VLLAVALSNAEAFKSPPYSLLRTFPGSPPIAVHGLSKRRWCGLEQMDAGGLPVRYLLVPGGAPEGRQIGQCSVLGLFPSRPGVQRKPRRECARRGDHLPHVRLI